MNHHFNIRPFKCSFCADTFYHIHDRNRHEQIIHEKIEDRYNCDKCDFKTYSPYALNSHKALKKCMV